MNPNVLIIDDDESIRDAFSLALENTEFLVDTAQSGQEGLEKFKAQKYGLIYLDLKMPGINGVDTLREVRKLDQEVPVYIVTAFHNEFLDQLQGLSDEGIAFELLNKPVGRHQIIGITRGILA